MSEVKWADHTKTPAAKTKKLFSKPSSDHIRKMWLLRVIGVLLGIVVLGIGLAALLKFNVLNIGEKKADAACSQLARQPLLEDATAPVTESTYQKSEKAVADIQKLPKYEEDPNCLYPIVAYYLNISDPGNAELYLSKLEKVYDDKQGYSPLLRNTKSIADLKKIVGSLKQQQDDLMKNALQRQGSPQ